MPAPDGSSDAVTIRLERPSFPLCFSRSASSLMDCALNAGSCPDPFMSTANSPLPGSSKSEHQEEFRLRPGTAFPKAFLAVLSAPARCSNEANRKKVANGGGAPWEAPSYAPGSSIQKRLPFPSSLSTRAVPPWAAATLRTIDSPSPVPPRLRERSLSTR